MAPRVTMRVFPLRNLAESQGMNVKTVAKQLRRIHKSHIYLYLFIEHSRKWFGYWLQIIQNCNF